MVSGLLAGCTPGGFLAGRILRSPNRYPEWVAPDARLYLDFNPGIVEGLPRHTFDAPGVAPLANDPARISYRVVPPAQYRLVAHVKHLVERGRLKPEYRFERAIPAPPHPAGTKPRGTVFLLHGYGLSQGSMLPWAFWCGDLGWNSVLVDLRGHGRSTGRHISFGPAEVRELEALMQHLERDAPLPRPIVVLGVSYGGAMALRWAAASRDIHSAIAIAPYPRLGPAAEGIRADFAPAVPAFLVRQAIGALPRRLGVPPEDLDTLGALRKGRPKALLLASDADVIAPPGDVEELQVACLEGSRLAVVHGPPHEELQFRLDLLDAHVRRWLADSADGLPKAPGLPRPEL